jgi:toxin YoeB
VKLIFSDHAWDDYLFWQKTDKKVLRRINTLIKETKRNPCADPSRMATLLVG